MRNRGARPADRGLPGGDLADADLQHVPHDHVVELLACYPRRHSGLRGIHLGGLTLPEAQDAADWRASDRNMLGSVRLTAYPRVAFIRRTDAREPPLETDPSGTKRYTAHYSSSVVCHLLISRSFTVAGG